MRDTAKNRWLYDRRATLCWDEPLEFVRGEGVWLFDATGRRYLDAFNNFAHVGHANPDVLDALGQRNGRVHITLEYANADVMRCAQRLAGTFKDNLQVVHFCSTGAQALDFALQVAIRCTSACGVILGRFSCHSDGFRLLPPWVRTINFPTSVDTVDAAPEQLARQFQQQIESQVSALEEAGYGVAALLLDPLLTFEGLPPLTPDIVKTGVASVRRAGGVYIADETHAGLGRTGRRFWGHERYGVTPDIVTLGESVANGIPMGAVITTSEIAAASGCHATEGHPSGGNPLICAVACATLDALERGELPQRALSVGEYLRHRLSELAAERYVLGEVRGEGHYLGIEVLDRARQSSFKTAQRLINQLAHNGILVSGTGHDGSVLQIRPPMPFALDHADLLADTFGKVVRELDPE